MTDREVQLRVSRAFDLEPAVDAATIGVAVRHGIVSLHGTVTTLQERWAAERVAGRLVGVRGLVCDLEVASDGRSPRTDAALADAIGNILTWHAVVPPHTVQATVRDGWVTLTGTVEDREQRIAAERAVGLIYGVKGVFSTIAVVSRNPETGGFVCGTQPSGYEVQRTMGGA